MPKQRKRIPHLRNQADKRVARTEISLRLPLWMLDRIQLAAKESDVPYQSLIKVWLAEKLDAE